MPRGYRSILLAVFGWLILATLPTGQSSASQRAKTQKEIVNSLEAIATSLDQANEPQRESADCPPGQDDRKSDLCAQWKAADAASNSAYWTEWTVWLGFVGLGLGAVTMGAAIAAARYAYRAAVATEKTVIIAQDSAKGADDALATAARNADAAADQVRISERTAHRQLRPYVYFEQARIIHATTGLRTLIVAIKNFGRTPAKHCEIAVSRQLLPYPLPAGTVFEAQNLEASNHTIPPGAAYEVLAVLPVGAAREIRDVKKCWAVTVTVTYKLMDETNNVMEETVTETALLNYHDLELGYGHKVLPRDYAHKEPS